MTGKKVKPDLAKFFDAKKIAIVGASNTFGKVGYDVVNNLSQFGYPGEIIPINPKSEEIQGYKAYKELLLYDQGCVKRDIQNGACWC